MDPAARAQALIGLGREIFVKGIENPDYEAGNGLTPFFTPEQAVEQANRIIDAALSTAEPSGIVTPNNILTPNFG